MALNDKYLVTTRNLEDFLNAIKTARAPERFTAKFLRDLDFTSSNDRLFLSLLKGIGFLDESGAPTPRYFAFLDQTQSGNVLAGALREAYADLFAVNTKANEMDVDQVKNKLRTLTQGQRSDKVVSLMANTFTALCALADWSESPASVPTPLVPADTQSNGQNGQPETLPAQAEQELPSRARMQLHYNIQLHLPDSRDPAVFDAIFQSLRRHLV